MYKIILIFVLSLFFKACGGGGSSSSNTTYKTAYLVDSAISGVEYTCDEIKGITGSSGEFNYNDECNITFKIGGILLGQIDGSSINTTDNTVFPADILQIARTNTNNQKTINLIQFLQSIDEDSNPNNNIVITEELRQIFKNNTLDFTKDTNSNKDVEKLVFKANKQFVSKENALKHYENVLKNKYGIDIYKNEIVETKSENNGFSYENQRDVSINILAESSTINKQILLYEKLDLVSTPVGELEKFNNLIISTVLNSKGELNITQTLGNHIQSIWLVIPYYHIKTELSIINNNIYFNINTLGEKL